ncbi:MAG: GSCFA domain-containing protein [Pseudomonadota bacterium]|uniref:GSCFA domain-containing protein n=1 Tax=Roseovarius TaxID=74030 RepID=UPI0022A89FC5|nr:GSCFA domain-containing protein [Roseovarius sp. EGI FJ00037]MCZ0812686.1 GSCFA domain-containing protein [Roseovarius sp. EGI FJ00037]
MRSPYQDLPDRAFWRSSVGRDDDASLAQLWAPKAGITRQTALMTIGSCFAQHLHRALVRGGWHVLQGEDMSAHLPTRLCHRFGYNLFSGRYGNVYTARQFRQLIEQALSPAPVPAPIWERDGRFFDALRPTVEPEGLGHPDEVAQSRNEHLAAVRAVLESAECIILTLGLTESWIDNASGYSLPTAPGTVAGDHDPARETFHNFTHAEVLEDLRASRDRLRAAGLPARFVLTVSPVPLVATAGGDHVASATAYSKAVLRAVCGELQMSDPDFDYFPAYEIVTTTIARGPYLDQFARQPTDEGVQLVLRAFSLALGAGDTAGKGADDSSAIPPAPVPAPVDDDTICEEILLEAFRK